ncbi:XRE family transcriptional regulator [Brumimicrobium glaciale]|uniref:XRE family transcriptional regulator n=1 Tax=Brumimicrobium glaciale TaxID=200475 RepID=A0A4Q4KJL7_9FLAO|nr:helix-turn-helix transcriptional regulator [Brumimicrobium glaciale]RYM32887.1 XRE family transcriptional regulator [Brumimicrobium glaciale]
MGKTNIDWFQMADAAIISKIGHFIKKTRLGLNKTQKQLAEDAGLNSWTISQIENGEAINLTSLIQLLRSLNALHVFDAFEIEDEISPLAYAKLKRKERERASGNTNVVNEPKEDLEW